MSTDTAFALGMLALIGPRFPGRLRSFMLTLAVVDDVLALIVIATVYTTDVAPAALLIAIALFAAAVGVRALGIRQGLVYVVLGTAIWVALYESGVEPVLTGLAMGLLASAYPPSRADLERASNLFRLFREQPTPDLARSARAGLESAISPNERLERLYHPWTSYVIVPLFALANAGIAIDGGFLSRAFSSPITLGIVVGYVVGKPVGIVGASWLTTRLSRGRLRPPVGWAAVAASGAVAGIGFTVSILIATLAFEGEQLEEAKLGVLSGALLASVATWLVFRATNRLPRALQARALLGGAEGLVDLAVRVDPEHDHVRGPADAPVTLVEYGDFQCPYCGQAEAVIRELLADFGDVRYAWRQLPLIDVHPWAQVAAEASEAAAAQGAFWEMHDLLLQHQDALQPRDLIGYAEQLGLDADRFTDELRKHTHAPRVAEDIDGADLSGVSGTPTFFINGRRHYGAYDIGTLSAAVRTARARAAVRSGSRARAGRKR
jgi:Na+/H+ antiporter NhaA/predicted DsbA family dithiol-disulfide isomerase